MSKPKKADAVINAMLEQLPLGVILSDTEGEIVYINHTAEKIRNVSRAKLLGRNIIDCHKKQSQENVKRAMNRIAESPQISYRRMVEDKKNEKHYINTYAGVSDENEKGVGIVVYTEDVTEKRKVELERATAYRMLQESGDNLKKRYHELLVASLESIMKLLEKRDVYTRYHSEKVCEYSLRMYEFRYGVGVDYDTLKIAASLHDIGKVGIPDEILRKPTRLTNDEYNVIKTHSVIAEEILRPLDTGSELSKIVRHHHEHFDGSGYPDGLRGNEIPELSRIIAIADAYDAMRSDRPYRKALSFENCIKEIVMHIGTQFDPEWSKVLLDLANTGSL